MRKHLRMLCMGVASVISLAGMAQAPTNVTNLLWNADFEHGPNGWDIVADQHNWSQNVKGDVKAPGYYGFNNLCLENWKSAGSGLTDNEVSQTKTGLPNGVYVFGAYMLATDDAWEPNREIIEGVTLFANESEVAVGTNRTEGVADSWGHTAKFNVAVRVTDGTLKVGVKCVTTNASFVCIDNATLYYFGEDIEFDAALDAMAQIDMQRSIAIADTCAALRMNVDTLAYLSEKMEVAKALTEATEAYAADEELWWGMRLARKSAADYQSLFEAIAAAKEIAAKTWSEEEATVEALAELNGFITQGEAEYAECKANRPEIEELKFQLAEAAAMLELDSCYVLLDEYTAICDELPVGEQMGEYTESDIDLIFALLEEVGMILDEVSEGYTSATFAKTECAKYFAQIDDVIAHPITFTEFPIVIKKSQTAVAGKYLMEGCEVNNDGFVTYHSPLYTFDHTLSKIRFIVKGMGDNYFQNGYPYFAASGFEMFDFNGDPIDITPGMISSNADHNTLNPNKIDGDGLMGLLDGNTATYFHSAWQNGPKEWHYLEVELPEGEYSAFSFKFISREGWPGQLPSELEIIHVTDIMDKLLELVAEATKLNPYQGTSPGFYNVDITAYYEALSRSEDAIANNASQGELEAAYKALKEQYDMVVESGRVMPDPEKKYRVVTSRKDFIVKQGLVKGWTIHTTDEAKPNWLWWETVDPENDMQEFIFEPIENAEGKNYYAIKHAATGLYLGDMYNAEGNRVANSFNLNAERKDTFELQSQGYAQFAIVRGGMIHLGSHNSGNGTTAATVLYPSGPNDWSSWWIRELVTLPYEAKSLSEGRFQSDALALYEGANFITLTADKECSFEGLVITDVLGNELPIAHMNASGTTVGVMLDGVMIDALKFSFDNAEGVATVTVNASISKMNDLQTAYDKALALNVVEGDGVGQVSDASKYFQALDAAEDVLYFGGTDEEIAKVIADLQGVSTQLQYNYPVPGQEYFIILSVPFYQKWGAEMAVFVKNNLVFWSYWNINNMTQRWQFVDCGELKNGAPAYYILNVGTEGYLSSRPDANSQLSIVEDTVETVPWDVRIMGGGKVSLGDSRYANGRWSLNPMNHKDGVGAYSQGTMFTWTNTDISCGMYIVDSEKVIEEFNSLYNTAGIEEVEVDEQVAPAVKGIFDLYGRRIEVPAATGIYIIDGKKVLVKREQK